MEVSYLSKIRRRFPEWNTGIGLALGRSNFLGLLALDCRKPRHGETSGGLASPAGGQLVCLLLVIIDYSGAGHPGILAALYCTSSHSEGCPGPGSMDCVRDACGIRY